MAEGFRKRWFKHRVAALLLILMGVLTWRAVIRIGEDRRVDWNVPHRVVICPLIAPGTDAAALAARLGAAPARLESWAAAQHEFWTGSRERPLELVVLPPMPVAEMPPWLPARDDSFWKRYRGTRRFLSWVDQEAKRLPPREGDETRIWLYVYRNLDRGAFEDRLPVGTKRGRMGVVFASDDPQDWENVLCVIAHETLHAVGARDHRRGDETIAFPEGYADPSAKPLLPQGKAEIMALGIPVTDTEELRVDSLDDVVMGLWTAKEIGWR
jgi:hypothetical protein